MALKLEVSAKNGQMNTSHAVMMMIVKQWMVPLDVVRDFTVIVSGYHAILKIKCYVT